jgi:hypothetical protein
LANFLSSSSEVLPTLFVKTCLENDNLTLPCEFSFEAGCNDVKSVAIFNTFIHPCILPAEFCGGRQIQSTFEY